MEQYTGQRMEALLCATVLDCVGVPCRRVYSSDGVSYTDGVWLYSVVSSAERMKDVHLLTRDDHQLIRAELEAHGWRHIHRALEEWGLVKVEKVETFSPDYGSFSEWPGGVIGFQFDTGRPSSGATVHSVIHVAGLELKFTY